MEEKVKFLEAKLFDANSDKESLEEQLSEVSVIVISSLILML